MIRIGIHLLSIATLLALAAPAGLRAESKAEEVPAPEFKEVYDLIREHLAGTSEAELNRAAVAGLVSELGAKVSVVTNGKPAAAAETRLVSRETLLDNAVAYVRIGRVEEGLAKAVRAACETLGASNKLKGRGSGPALRGRRLIMRRRRRFATCS